MLIWQAHMTSTVHENTTLYEAFFPVKKALPYKQYLHYWLVAELLNNPVVKTNLTPRVVWNHSKRGWQGHQHGGGGGGELGQGWGNGRHINTVQAQFSQHHSKQNISK